MPLYAPTAFSDYGVSLKAAPFLAKGDGTADDTAAVQAWLSYLAANGGVGYAPPGTYRLTAQVGVTSGTKPFTVRGAGWGVTVFRKDYTSAGSTAPIKTVNRSDVSFEDFTIDVNKRAYTGSHGITFQNGNRVYARRIEVVDWQDTAIMMFADTPYTYHSGIMENCRADNTGLGTANNGFLIIAMDRSGMSNCWVKGARGTPGLGLQLKNECRWGWISDGYADDCTVAASFGCDTTTGVQWSRIGGVVSYNCICALSLFYAKYNNISDIVSDNINDGLEVLRFSTNNQFNTVTGVVVNNPLYYKGAVRFLTASHDNYVEIDFVNCPANANPTAAIFDSGVQRNVVELGRVYGTARKINTNDTNLLVNNSTNTTNVVRFKGGFPIYTVAGLPAAAEHKAFPAYISDGAGSKRLAVSDGTSWLWPDGTAVS